MSQVLLAQHPMVQSKHSNSRKRSTRGVANKDLSKRDWNSTRPPSNPLVPCTASVSHSGLSDCKDPEYTRCSVLQHTTQSLFFGQFHFKPVVFSGLGFRGSGLFHIPGSVLELQPHLRSFMKFSLTASPQRILSRQTLSLPHGPLGLWQDDSYVLASSQPSIPVLHGCRCQAVPPHFHRAWCLWTQLLRLCLPPQGILQKHFLSACFQAKDSFSTFLSLGSLLSNLCAFSWVEMFYFKINF